MALIKPKQKFVIVSNRLPVSVSRVNGKLEFKPSPGGLATAVSSLDNNAEERLWIGWPGISNEELKPGDKTLIKRKLRQQGCFPVFLDEEQVKNYYGGYSNDTIWPMFHYFQSLAQFNNEYWDAYKEVNQLFAEAVADQADERASIWVHDYQLMLLPQLVRSVMPRSSIGFFLHIPFPSYEIFRLMPNRRELLEGILGADLIGFHVYDYGRHFMSSVLRILGLESSHGSIVLPDRIATVDVFPIGIDYKKFKESVRDPAVVKEIKSLNNHYNKQKVIISVDRLDYSKGIRKRLESYATFLEQNPQYHKKIVLVVIAVPSRTEVESYQLLRDQIEQTVSRINGKYASLDWMPIAYQFKNLPYEQLVALYARADVALVTPLRDGMNLVAKEYVATKQESPGVLILSEMAGSVDELPEALSINPNDSASIIEALEIALTMPKREQRQRLESMQRRLSRYTVQRWATDFMEQLAHSKKVQAERREKDLPEDAKLQLIQDFKKAKKRLIILDYDGTMRELVSSHKPAQATPPAALMQLLQKMIEMPKTKVAVISGRPREVMEKWFGRMDLAMAAEHGAWVKESGEWSQAQVSFQKYKNLILPILERYLERTPGAVIEEKRFAVVWHYRNVAPELAYVRNSSLRHELNHVLENSDIGIHNGHKIIEMKPRGINKGVIAQELLAMYPSDFILAAGDDYTDEAMFEALPEEAYSIKVGLGETHAHFRLPRVKNVLSLLEELTEK
ncbi:MAG: bifunctional alpha,alpha-trehalose-phosphate synthase (UDP-forming)/trehalose-phosphatase [Patescibacteria group bacterium]